MIRVLLIELEVPSTARVAELVEQIHEAAVVGLDLAAEDVRIYPAQTAALRYRTVSGRPPKTPPRWKQ